MNMDACINHNYNNLKYASYIIYTHHFGNMEAMFNLIRRNKLAYMQIDFFSIPKDANNVLRSSVMVKHTAERTHAPIVTETEDDDGALQ